MSEIHETASRGFGSGSDDYERGRPGYPPDAVAWLVARLPIRPGSRVLDLAAGTGKLTRQLVASGARLVAVEPVAAMRAKLSELVPGVEVLDGRAESIPLPDGSVDAVTVAQAFHWFRHDEALVEVARVLRPGGGMGLVWNERDESVEWVAELSRLIGWHSSGIPPYGSRADTGGTVERSGLFGPVEHRLFTLHQELDADTLVARVLSTSYIAAGPEERRRALEADVRALVADFEPVFTLPYRTEVYCCRRLP